MLEEVSAKMILLSYVAGLTHKLTKVVEKYDQTMFQWPINLMRFQRGAAEMKDQLERGAIVVDSEYKMKYRMWL